nr:hypothetical protein REQ54_00026 [Rhizobium sp. Q54]
MGIGNDERLTLALNAELKACLSRMSNIDIDAMAAELQAKFPHRTVQQISTRIELTLRSIGYRPSRNQKPEQPPSMTNTLRMSA